MISLPRRLFSAALLSAVIGLSPMWPALPVVAEGEDTAFIWFQGINTYQADVQKEWFVSNFSIKNPDFRTAWKRKSVRVQDGALELLLRPSRGRVTKDYIGGEVQRKTKTLYGRYEVVMTAARGEGVISSFFTYTGPYFGDPHDEIDFEFLGRDTTKVWLNRFTAGEKLPGQWIDLGFDAAEGPHLYAFEWSPDEIVWYADGRELLRVKAEDTALPTTPSKVYINIWAGGEKQEKWSGTAPEEANIPKDNPEDIFAMARYYCLSHQPAGDDTPQCSDRPPFE